VLGSKKRVPPSDRINIAFIGTGNNGINWMKAFLEEPTVQVVAVCDVNKMSDGYWNNSVRGRKVAQKIVNEYYSTQTHINHYNGCTSFEDFRQIFTLPDVDAVYIGTPDHWHAIMVEMAARAGKDIYCQKPLSLTISEGKSMVKAVNKYRVVFQTGSQQRSDYNFRRACELVRNGRIGKLHTVKCGLPGGTPDLNGKGDQTNKFPIPKGFNYDMWLGPAPFAAYCPARCHVNFRWNLDYSGGQITDWGGHHPDIAQWGMDTEYTGPVKIQNPQAEWSKHPIWNTATDYYYECIYKNGVKLIISNRVRSGVTFEGSEGIVWANRGQHDAWPKSLLREKIDSSENHLYKSDNHVKNFLDCVYSRKKTIAPVEVGHRSISLAHLGNIAIQLKRDLDWDPDNQVFINDADANRKLCRSMRGSWQLS
jgi:predicted dehydrogenase